MAELARLEEECAKCRARLLAASTDKCRHRTLFDLASIEARLGRPDEAIAALWQAIASGLDLVYSVELRSSQHFEALWELPDFHRLLSALEGKSESGKDTRVLYATGEKEKCLADALLCGLCNEPLRQPFCHNLCGSLFCAACLTPSRACPQCQGFLTPETVSKTMVRFILSKLDALKVHCPRCFKIIERASLDGHVETCPVYCPSGCKQRVSPTALEEHARVCVAVEVPCSAADVQCEWKGSRKDLYNHTRSCPLVKQQAVLRRVMALEETLVRRVTALEEANRELDAANREICDLKARVARLEGTENALIS
jgi:hypothetical protein